MNTSVRAISMWIVMLAAVLAGGGTPALAQSRSVGEMIDDTSITAEVKTRLTADRLANLTQIGVNTRNRVVTLTGTVDSLERAAHAAQIAGSVKGVRGVVNNILVAAAPGAPSPPAASVPDQPTVDVTGVVASIDPVAGIITLQDGRVLRVTSQTLVWQPVPVDAVRPGTQVLVRGAVPAVVQSGTTSSDWRMGTVRSVDRATSQLVLTDGTVVRVPPSVNIRYGSERLTLEQLGVGSEVVIRPMAPSPAATAEGSALPGRTGTPAVIDAAEINVVWTPAGGR